MCVFPPFDAGQPTAPRNDAGRPDTGRLDAALPDTGTEAGLNPNCGMQACMLQQAICGPVTDECGDTQQCGQCASGTECDEDNQCVPTQCTPRSCTNRCGWIDDGCGENQNCMGCDSGRVCQNSRCVMPTCTDQRRNTNWTAFRSGRRVQANSSYAAWSFAGRAGGAPDGEGANALFSRLRKRSEYLFLHNPGIHIPSNATVTGVAVDITYNLGSDQDAIPPELTELRLFSDGRGGQSANNTASSDGRPWAPVIGNNYRDFTVGGPNDKWGASLPPSYFNHSGFGIRLRAECSQCDAAGEASRLLIDSASVNVYYTVPVCTP